MGTYRVSGSRQINGRAHGKLVELDEDVVNVDALLTEGHIERVRTPISTDVARRAGKGK